MSSFKQLSMFEEYPDKNIRENKKTLVDVAISQAFKMLMNKTNEEIFEIISKDLEQVYRKDSPPYNEFIDKLKQKLKIRDNRH